MSNPYDTSNHAPDVASPVTASNASAPAAPVAEIGAFVAGVVLVGIGGALLGGEAQPASFGAAAALCAAGVGAVIYGASRLARLGDTQSRLLQQLAQENQLTDSGRSIAWRKENLELLTRAIESHIEEHRFNSAMALIHELTDTYGEVETAEAFRERVQVAGKADYEHNAEEAVKQLDTMLAMDDFEAAIQQSKKIKRLYSDSPRAQNVTERVVDSLEGYKKRLAEQFRELAQRGDVDQAMELLQDLDKHLTPKEAQPLMELARDVIGKKKSNLGMQFKLALHDKAWSTAIRVGEQLLEHFPDSKMSNEYKRSKPKLKTLAVAAEKRTPAPQSRRRSAKRRRLLRTDAPKSNL